jgi:hypothetical protein
MIYLRGLLDVVSRITTRWNQRAQLPWRAGAQICLGDGAGVIAYSSYNRRVRLVGTCGLLRAKRLDIKQLNFVNT